MDIESVAVTEKTDVVIVKAKPARRIYKATGRTINKIPPSILNDPEINEAITALPQNYNFELHKTIWRVRELKAKRVALQLPEGRLLIAFTIEIFKPFADTFNYFFEFRFVAVFIGD